MLNDHLYEENKNLELKIAPIIKEKIYRILYPKCTFIDNRDKNSIVSKTENFLKSSKISDDEIKYFLDTRSAIDVTVTPQYRIPTTFQEKCVRNKCWNNKYYWFQNLPKIRIRYQRKVTFEDGNVRIYPSEFFKICADNYLIAYLDVNENIQEWVMLDVCHMKHIINTTKDLKTIGELIDDKLKDPKIPNAVSFCSFPIYNLRESIVTGSNLFKDYIRMNQYKSKKQEELPLFN